MTSGISLKDRPGDMSVTTTPLANALLELCGGGFRFGNVALTRDQLKAVQRLYGYTPEQPIPPPAEPAPPVEPPWGASYAEMQEFSKKQRAYEVALDARKRWQKPHLFQQAGADRNALRCAEMDGLRMLVWLAKYVEPGQDPLKLLVQAMSDAGYDVDPEEYAWATGQRGSEEESDE